MRGQTMTQQRYNNNKTTKNSPLANVENLYKMNNFWKKYKYKKMAQEQREILNRLIIIREIKGSQKSTDPKHIAMDCMFVSPQNSYVEA